MANPTSDEPDRRAEGERRAELLEELQRAGRASSAATVMFHTVVAEQLGITATQEKALDLLARQGPLTAGELANQAGLKPATVTDLVDALEEKGFVRRTRNPVDRRSVVVELDEDHVLAAFAPLYADWIRELDELYAGYTDDQLQTIVHFLMEAANRQQRVTTSLTARERDATPAT